MTGRPRHEPGGPHSDLPVAPVDAPTTNVADDRYLPLGRRLRNLAHQLRTQGLRITLIEAVDQLHRMLRGAPTRRRSQIAPGLAIGGQHARRGLPLLRQRGVTALVNLRYESDDAARGRVLGRYLYLPTIDNTPPTLEDLEKGAAFIGAELARGGGVYVHCWEGVGRAPTLACAYLVSTGRSPEEAWSAIRRVRPFIRPTPFQVAQVERFAERLRERRVEEATAPS